MFFEPVAEALWFILPAYAANGLAILARGKKPLDLGRKLGDRRRVFGDGKTFEGFFLGIFIALIIALVQGTMQKAVAFPPGLNPVQMTPQLGLALGAGAMLGDLAASFVKRRMGKEKGEPVLFLDQLDFIAGSLLLSSFIVSLSALHIILLAVLTMVLHRLTNLGAYKLRLKDRPY